MSRQNGFHDYMTKFGTLSHIAIVMKAMFWCNDIIFGHVLTISNLVALM
jgi:hypothetical protein